MNTNPFNQFFEKVKTKTARINFNAGLKSLESNGKLFALTILLAFFLMAVSAFAIFLINIKGPEKVLVPDVVGKNLEDALLVLQAKELYPKIQIRYSDDPNNKGTILEQSPEAGAIRKGYSRISLVVSRGTVIDKVGNYIGKNVEDVRMELQTLFAGAARQMITIGNISYKADDAPAGSILEQEPLAETSITDAVALSLVVSRGPQFENARVPNLTGFSIEKVLQEISRTRLIFDFAESSNSSNGEAIVASMQTFDTEFVENYTHVAVEIALPHRVVNEMVYGIFEANLEAFPYPVQLKFSALPEEGDEYTLTQFYHTGGKVTLPYAVPKNTTLSLSIVSNAGKRVVQKISVR